MKKLVSLLLCLTFICSLTTTGYASEKEVTKDDGTISVQYMITCDGGGKHQMHPRGRGICYTGTPENKGSIDPSMSVVSQCSECDLWMISNYYPGSDTRFIGAYTITNNIIASHDEGYVFYGGRMGEYWSLTEDAYIQGFEFLMS
jgi:hypothetical protein